MKRTTVILYHQQKCWEVSLPREVLNYRSEVLGFHPDEIFNIPLEDKKILKIYTQTWTLKFIQVLLFVHFLNQNKLDQHNVTEHENRHNWNVQK